MIASDVTLVGAGALLYGQLALVDDVVRAEQVCGAPGCGLGIVAWLIGAAVVTLALAVSTGLMLGLARRQDTPRPGVAVRRGLLVAGWCLLGYLLVSAVLWLPKS